MSHGTSKVKTSYGNTTKVVLWLVAVVLSLAVAAAALVLFTTSTRYTSVQVREWVFSVGALLGGILSASAAVLVAAIGFSSQRRQALESENQMRLQAAEAREVQAASTRVATNLRRIGEHRRSTSELVTVVANDLSWLDEVVTPSIQSMTHQELSHAFDGFIPALSSRYSRARGAIALTPHRNLRNSAENVYTAWTAYLVALDNSVTNSIPMPQNAQSNVLAADKTFFDTVDARLEALDAEESGLL